ncbi:MAG TPA: hypothetical protein VGY49_02235 [Burkholderiaceae bacterium]|jgi:hypothetical protein|nr:hypothetical protein [Burkholderiaceae bacterium]
MSNRVTSKLLAGTILILVIGAAPAARADGSAREHADAERAAGTPVTASCGQVSRGNGCVLYTVPAGHAFVLETVTWSTYFPNIANVYAIQIFGAVPPSGTGLPMGTGFQVNIVGTVAQAYLSSPAELVSVGSQAVRWYFTEGQVISASPIMAGNSIPTDVVMAAGISGRLESR